MDFPELDHHVLTSFVEFQKITREICPMSDEACAEDMAQMIRDSCLSHLAEKRKQRDQLIEEGKNLIDEIVEKRELLSDVPDQNNHLRAECSKLLVPPYKLSISKLHEKIKEIDTIFNERSTKRNHLISEICSISVAIGREAPHFSDSLCQANLARLSETHDILANEKIKRQKQRDIFEVKLNGMKRFLGIDQFPSFVDKLDDEALEEFRDYLDGLTGKYVSLKETFGRLSSKMRLLSSTLDLECDVGDEDDGSAERLTFLEKRLGELNQLKQERIGEIIPRCLCQLANLWTQLSLDVSKRQKFDSALHTSENLEAIETEISRMDAMLMEPERTRILKKIDEYKEIRILEAELQEAQRDPGRLARRGFTQTLRNEEIKRKRISQSKPGIITSLIAMIEHWQQEHDGETFFLDNQVEEEDLLKSLIEEKNRPGVLSRTRTQRADMQSRRTPQPIARGPTAPRGGPVRPQQRHHTMPGNSAAAAARLAASRAPIRAPPLTSKPAVPRPAMSRPQTSRPVSARPVPAPRPVSTAARPVSFPRPTSAAARPVSSGRPVARTAPSSTHSVTPRVPAVHSTAVHGCGPNTNAQPIPPREMGLYSDIESEHPTSFSSSSLLSSSLRQRQGSPRKQDAKLQHHPYTRNGAIDQPQRLQHSLSQSHAGRKLNHPSYSGRVEKKKVEHPANPGISSEILRRVAFQDASKRLNIPNGGLNQPKIKDASMKLASPGIESKGTEYVPTTETNLNATADNQPPNWESWRIHQFEDNDMSYFGGGSVGAEQPSFNYERDAF